MQSLKDDNSNSRLIHAWWLIGVLLFIGATGLAMIAPGVYSRIMDRLQGADAKISNLSFEPNSGIVNGQLDFGYKVSFTIENIGKRGAVTISPKISCSEGEWTRTQTLNLDVGESHNLTYFFHEPTINATNIECSAKILP